MWLICIMTSIRISCEKSVVEKAASMVSDFPDVRTLDCMQDYILSQGLANEVVE